MKSSMSCLVTLATILALGGQARAGDWLDVKARQVRILQGGTTVKEGQSVKFDCSWSLDFADDHSYWRAQKTERFPVRLDVDSQVLLTDEGVVAQGTELERPDGGFSSGLRGTSKPATWEAKGVGQHRLFCTVNDPKGISDQYPANNQKFVVITVLPELAVQPGQPWPSPSGEGGDAPSDASARKNGLGDPAVPDTGQTRMSNPMSKTPSKGSTRALNPQPEVPSKGNIRALNPQPEVPSKPEPSDKKQSKKKQRSLPPKY